MQAASSALRPECQKKKYPWSMTQQHEKTISGRGDLVTCQSAGVSWRNICSAPLASKLRNKFGEIEWTNHARLVVEETSLEQRENIKKKQLRRRVRHQSADLPDAAALAHSVDSPRGPSTIDQLFSEIYDNIDKQRLGEYKGKGSTTPRNVSTDERERV